MRPLLRFEQVALRRGGRLLFECLDLNVGPGEALLVTGPNGSGKSSLLRLAAGLLRPERGKVERAGPALADDRLALDRELPLGKALGFWGGATVEALDALGLTPFVEVPVRLLSAGQAKRASLARATASGAALWLLDEPLNGLDRAGIERFAALADWHRQSGGAIVAASHSPPGGEWAVVELAQSETT